MITMPCTKNANYGPIVGPSKIRALHSSRVTCLFPAHEILTPKIFVSFQSMKKIGSLMPKMKQKCKVLNTAFVATLNCFLVFHAQESDKIIYTFLSISLKNLTFPCDRSNLRMKKWQNH